MKTTFKCLLLPVLAALLLPLFASAAVTVENVTAKQRYPWNGNVDITCTVSGMTGAGDPWTFTVSSMNMDSGVVAAVSHIKLMRGTMESDDLSFSTNGDYRLVWNAFADLGEVNYSNLVVRVDALKLGHGKIQLWKDGPYWATKNIGAEEPEEYGLYFWWGDTVGYHQKGRYWVASDGSSQDFSFDSGNTPTYGKSNDTLQREGWTTSPGRIFVPEHDAAQAHWGGLWRIPTYEEFDALVSNCDWTWTTQNNVAGYIICGRGDYASNRIFLPAAGFVQGTSLYTVGSDGSYWSSLAYTYYSYSYYARKLTFDSGSHSMSFSDRYSGFPIRPVQEFAE